MTGAQVPKVGRAGPIKNAGPDFSIDITEEYPVPTPGEGELLVKNVCTGICQSDFHTANGDWGLLPVPGVDCMGHEGAGHVVAVGPGVTGWKVGDRAGTHPVYSTCENCDYCNNDLETLCPDRKLFLIHNNGTYAQYICTRADFTVRIPESVELQQAGPFMCSGGTAYTAVKNANLRPGQWVVVKGAGGGVGHMVVQFAKAQGFKVIGVDVGADKKEVAMEAGASEFIDASSTDNLTAKVKELTGGLGAHAVIVAVGHKSAYDGSVDLLRPGGTMVVVGLPKAGTAIAGADPNAIAFGGITIKGILVTTRKDLEASLKFLADGKVKEHITVMPFKDLPKAFYDVANSKVKGRAVVNFED